MGRPSQADLDVQHSQADKQMSNFQLGYSEGLSG